MAPRSFNVAHTMFSSSAPGTARCWHVTLEILLLFILLFVCLIFKRKISFTDQHATAPSIKRTFQNHDKLLCFTKYH